MADQSLEQQLHALLRFRPWPPGDPATILLRDQLDKASLTQIALSALEHHKTMLDAESKLVDKIHGIVSKQAR